jgi:large subunit ribosomal protein L31
MADNNKIKKEPRSQEPAVHPDYHQITVVMNDGSEFTTRSTYGEKGSKLHLDIDPKTHPAWTGTHRLMNRGGQLEKFNKRFAGIKGNKPADGEEEAAPAKAAAAPGDKIKLTTTAASAKKNKA